MLSLETVVKNRGFCQYMNAFFVLCIILEAMVETNIVYVKPGTLRVGFFSADKFRHLN